MVFFLWGVTQHKKLHLLLIQMKARAMPMSTWRGTKVCPLLILQGVLAFLVHVILVIVNTTMLEGETVYQWMGEIVCILLLLSQGEFLHIMVIFLQKMERGLLWMRGERRVLRMGRKVRGHSLCLRQTAILGKGLGDGGKPFGLLMGGTSLPT